MVLGFVLFFGWTPRAAWAGQAVFPAGGRSAGSEGTDPTARSAALGGVCAGMSGDASALWSNPAGLASVPLVQAALHTRLGFVGTLQETLALGFPLGHGAGAGFSLGYLDYGAFEGRDDQGSLAPGYGADQWDLRIGGGLYAMRGLSLGAAFGLSRWDWAGNSGVLAVPVLGLVLQPFSDWKVGLAYKAPGWGPEGWRGVSRLDAGVSWEVPLDPSLRLMTVFGGALQSSDLHYLRGGMELSFRSRYFLRAGYKAALGGESAEGPGAGAGLALGGLTLDYAFLPAGDLGNTHRVSLGYVFGNGAGRGTEDASGKPGNSGTRQDPVGALGPGGNPASMEQPPPALGTDGNGGPTTSGGSDVQGQEPERLKLEFSIPPDFMVQASEMESQGKSVEAARLYQEALREDARNVRAWWSLGNLYLKAGKKAEALQCMERVLQLEPGNQAMREWLEHQRRRP